MIARTDPGVLDDVVAVVCTSGTTNAGIIDDLDGVGALAEERGWWFHVDGAYGGAGVLVPSLKPKYAGIERADSFIVDPHKWMFTPFDCCALIYKRPELARRTHTQDASYLDVIRDQGGEWNPTDYAYHLTRRARGLPLWFSLAVNGVGGLPRGDPGQRRPGAGGRRPGPRRGPPRAGPRARPRDRAVPQDRVGARGLRRAGRARSTTTRSRSSRRASGTARRSAASRSCTPTPRSTSCARSSPAPADPHPTGSTAVSSARKTSEISPRVSVRRSPSTTYVDPASSWASGAPATRHCRSVPPRSPPARIASAVTSTGPESSSQPSKPTTRPSVIRNRGERVVRPADRAGRDVAVDGRLQQPGRALQRYVVRGRLGREPHGRSSHRSG